MNTQPSFARCILHVRAVTRTPSRFRFYAGGIIREFSNPFGEFLVAGFFLIILLNLINLFF
jgi:hypothetical protein